MRATFDCCWASERRGTASTPAPSTMRKLLRVVTGLAHPAERLGKLPSSAGSLTPSNGRLPASGLRVRREGMRGAWGNRAGPCRGPPYRPGGSLAESEPLRLLSEAVGLGGIGVF